MAFPGSKGTKAPYFGEALTGLLHVTCQSRGAGQALASTSMPRFSPLKAENASFAGF